MVEQLLLKKEFQKSQKWGGADGDTTAPHAAKKLLTFVPKKKQRSAHPDADYDEETAFDNYFNPEAGHRAGPEGPTNA